MWFALGVIAICLCILHYSIRLGRKGRLIDKMPGPTGWPVIGSVVDYFGDNPWIKVFEYNEKFWPIYRIWGYSYCLIHPLHPDDLEIILSSSKHIDKSVLYDFLQPWLQTGLLTSKGEKWHSRRKILTPAFHFNILQKYMEVMTEHGVKMVDSLKSEGKEVIIDLEKFCTKYTLSTICETAMGTTISGTEDESENFRKAVHIVGLSIVRRFFRYFPLSSWIYYNLVPIGRLERKSVKTLHEFSTKIINERKVYHEKTGGKYLDEIRSQTTAEDEDLQLGTSKYKRRRLAMLDLLIAASNDGLIDEKGILEEVNTFIFEGNDTTAAAFMYILQLLAEHTEIQKKAREEVDEVWNACNGKLTIADINKLSFLERCIKETLRLFPSVPLVSRVLTSDLQLKNYLVPKDTIVQIMIVAIHRDERFWPNAKKFDPDRFLPENNANRHPFQYIPFSAGPRNCIGQKFAMLEVKTFCVYLLHNFQLEAQRSCMDLDIKADLVYRPLSPFFVKFTPIKHE